MKRRSTAPPSAAVALGLAVLVAGCGDDEVSAARPYDDVEELFEDLGGEDWCGTPLTVRLPPAVGRCGADDGTVALATAYIDREQVLTSVSGARGDGLLLLLPSDLDADGPWFQLRSGNAELLAEARAVQGGEILDGDDAIDDWLDRNDG